MNGQKERVTAMLQKETLYFGKIGLEIESKHNTGRENLELLRKLIPEAIAHLQEKENGRFRILENHNHMDVPKVTTKEYWMHPMGVKEIKIQTNGEKPKLTYKRFRERFGPIFVRTEKKVEAQKENFREMFEPYLRDYKLQGEVINTRYSMMIVEKKTNRVLRITLDLDNPTNEHVQITEALKAVQMEVEYEGILISDNTEKTLVYPDITKKNYKKLKKEIIPLIIDTYSYLIEKAAIQGIQFQDGQRKADRFAV